MHKIKKCNEEIENSNNIFLDILDEQNRTIYVYNEINNQLAYLFSKYINHLNKLNNKPINIYINSIGGDVYSSNSIVTEIKLSKAKVITNVMGVAYSSAGDILLAGDIRKMSKFGLIMFHSPSITIESEPSLYNTKQYIKYIEENSFKIITELLKDTKIDLKYFKNKIKNKEWFLNAEESLKLGIIHEIIG